MAICGRGAGLVLLLLLAEGCLATTLDPMAILRTQMAYIKAHDHMPSTQGNRETAGDLSPPNLRDAISSESPRNPHTTYKSRTAPSGDLNSPRTTDYTPTVPSQASISPHTMEYSPTASQNVLNITQSTQQPPTSNQSKAITQRARVNSHSSILGSLFELGMNDVDEEEADIKKLFPMKPIADHKEVMASLTDLIEELGNMTFLPFVPQEGSSPKGEANGKNSTLHQYLDSLRNDAWGQFKGVALSYTNWLEREYKVQPLMEKLPLDLIKKVLDLGDRVNFLHVVGKKVDPGLAKFLADQLQPLFSHFEKLTAGKLVGGQLSSAIGGVVRDAAWKTMHQFVNHVLKVADNFVTKEDLEKFKEDLAKTSPIAAKGLDVVLNGPPEVSIPSEGRSLSSRSGYRDGGYGGYGAYDESYGSYQTQGYSGGYTAGIFLDPYLILAGLGSAVLLAYLAYRVIVTTADGNGNGNGNRRRSFNDLTFMDLSDVPGVVHSLYSMLEDAEDKYRDKRSVSPYQDDSDDLIHAVNSLWWEHEASAGCVRCYLFDYYVEHVRTSILTSHDLAVAALAQLLGSSRSGQLLDEVTGLVLEGEPITCQRKDNTCDLQ